MKILVFVYLITISWNILPVSKAERIKRQSPRRRPGPRQGPRLRTGPGPGPGPRDEQPTDVFFGLKYTWPMRGPTTLQLRGPPNTRLQLAFVDMFLSPTPNCTNLSTTPHLKINVRIRPDRVSNHWLTTSLKPKTGSEYNICGKLKDVAEKVWLFDNNKITLTFNHLESKLAFVHLRYDSIQSLNPSQSCYSNETTFTYLQPYYNSNEFCEWNVNIDDTKLIAVKFDFFNLEYSGPNCEYDKLFIYDGPDSSYPLLGKFCGYHRATVYSSSNDIYMLFESDVNSQSNGFELSYDEVEKDAKPFVLHGVYKFHNSSGKINCQTESGCQPSFRKKAQDHFVFDVSVPLGLYLELDWSVKTTGKQEDVLFRQIRHASEWDTTDINSESIKIINGTHGILEVKFFKTVLHIATTRGIGMNIDIRFSSSFDIDQLRSGCNQHLVTRNIATTIAQTISVDKRHAYCVTRFKTSKPGHFIRVAVDNDYTKVGDASCSVMGIAIYDAERPGDETKLMGPFCDHDIPTSLMSTQEYLTVVTYVDSSFKRPIHLHAKVYESECLPLYYNSVLSRNVDLRIYPCLTLINLPSYKKEDVTVTLPINVTRYVAYRFRIDRSEDIPYKKEQDLTCRRKIGCVHYYKPEPNDMASKATCDATALAFIPHSIYSSCLLAGAGTSVTVRKRRRGKRCFKQACNKRQEVIGTEDCGSFYFLPALGRKNKNQDCVLIISRLKRNCEEHPKKSNPKYKYRIRYQSKSVLEIEERIYSDPCGGLFTEHKHSSLIVDDKTHVITTIGSDYIKLETAKISFTIAYEVVSIEQPKLTFEQNCSSGNSVFYGKHCYELRSFPRDYTWNDASADCVMNAGGTLLNIMNQDELTFIKKMVASYWMRQFYRTLYSGIIYLGMRRETKHQYVELWNGTYPIRFADWHQPMYTDRVSDISYNPPKSLSRLMPNSVLQPALDEHSRCATMYIVGPSINPSDPTHWTKLPCNFPVPRPHHICKALPIGNKPISTMKAGAINSKTRLKGYAEFQACHFGWTFVDGTCLRLVTSLQKLDTSLSYNGAIDMCSALDSVPAKIGNNMLPMLKYVLSLWKHRPEYRGIWLLSDGQLCNVVEGKEDYWETANNLAKGHRGSDIVFDFVLKQLNCDRWDSSVMNTDVHFTLDISLSSEYNINSTDWTTNKRAATGPLSVLCERPTITEREFGDCGVNQFTCSDGTCIFTSQVCDGVRNCLKPAETEEVNCNCGSNMFRCGSGECIPHTYYCDFTKHCKDGSDEDSCIYPHCPDNYFRCGNGQCIDRNKTCDFRTDCPMREDESQTVCNWRHNCSQYGFQCYSDLCLPRAQINDLQTDCPTVTAEDESLKYIESVRGKIKDIDEIETETTDESYIYSNYSPFCSNTNEVRCYSKHVACFRREMSCIYEETQYEHPVVDGCRDNSHLRNCSKFECPGMFKCPGSFCIPNYRVCDSKPDCPYGEDESDCEEYSCPGQFRCPGRRNCLKQDQLCDGHPHCNDGADELFCDLPVPCPSNCSCNMYTMDCANRSFIHVPPYSTKLRALGFSHNQLKLNDDTFKGYDFLGKLDLSYNNITRIPEFAFTNLKNIYQLDLFGNNISRIDKAVFDGLSLRVLNISENLLTYVSMEALRGLISVDVIDMRNNPDSLTIDANAFYNVSVNTIFFDASRHCCVVSVSNHCFPHADEFASCDDLLANRVLEVAIWIIGFAAFFGNLAVFIFRLRSDEHNVSSFLVLNLSVADFFMGLYLLFLASADQYFQRHGPYYLRDKFWREGPICQFLGAISTLSSEMSVFTLVVITIDRVLVVVFSAKRKSLTKMSAVVVMTLGWVCCIGVSVLPIFVYGVGFYGKTSVCLPFTLREVRGTGWQYSVIVFFGVNLLAFLTIAFGYAAIYAYVGSVRTKAGRKASAQDMEFARRVVLIVVTDFLCWVPIIIIGIIALAGVTIDQSVSVYVPVFGMPINSALNPLLYTLSSTKHKIRCCRDRPVENSQELLPKHKNRSPQDVYVLKNSGDLADTSLPSTPDLSRDRKNLVTEIPLNNLRQKNGATYSNRAFTNTME